MMTEPSVSNSEHSSNPPNDGPPPKDWAGLVARIQRNDPDAMAELYEHFARGVRYFLCRQLGSAELDDKVHDVFVIVVQAIQKGDLREPERLMGFVRTILRRQVATHIEHSIQNRREYAELEPGICVADQRSTPEDTVIRTERQALMTNVLNSLSKKDREVLTRFYLNEQSQEQICSEMNLTHTQCRLLKSRAKQRFGELGRRTLDAPPTRRGFSRFFGRVSH